MLIEKNLKDVLIIEDDEDITAILTDYCRNMGCFRHIVTARDGALATQKLQNQRFALILLDMNMPKKSGLDLLAEFDRHSQNSKDNVLVVSGTLEKELIAKVINRGVKSFLVKPFDESQFKDKVSKILKL